jgi:hypothetical protein
VRADFGFRWPRQAGSQAVGLSGDPGPLRRKSLLFLFFRKESAFFSEEKKQKTFMF